MSDKKRIYYCDIDNFGDALNRVLVENLAKESFLHSDLMKADIIGIGSILDKLLFTNKNYILDKFSLKNKSDLKIFSSGFGFMEDFYLNKRHKHIHLKKYINPLKLRRNIDCLAIRGRYSLNLLNKVAGKEFKPQAIGDGGLLARFLVDESKIEKIYDFGIVPHYAESNEEIFKEINNKLANSIILDTEENTFTFLKKLARCKYILSTAMHPLIAADSLNIPNLWIRNIEKVTSYSKFLDYYSALDTEKKPVSATQLISLSTQDIIDIILKNKDISYTKIEKIQNELLNIINNNFYL